MVTIATTGVFLRPASSRARYLSPGPIRSGAGTQNPTMSTSVRVERTRLSSRSPSSVRGRCNPGVSRRTSCASGRCTMPRITRRVVCGRSLVIATFVPTSALVRVDLPTLGRPTRHAKPDRKAVLGRSGGRGTGRRTCFPGAPGLLLGHSRRAHYSIVPHSGDRYRHWHGRDPRMAADCAVVRRRSRRPGAAFQFGRCDRENLVVHPRRRGSPGRDGGVGGGTGAGGGDRIRRTRRRNSARWWPPPWPGGRARTGGSSSAPTRSSSCGSPIRSSTSAAQRGLRALLHHRAPLVDAGRAPGSDR